MTIEIVKGCLFKGFENNEFNLLCHQVNCCGVMGSGVALEVKNRFPNAYESYKTLCNNAEVSLLGEIQRVVIADYTQVPKGKAWWSKDVVNIFGQSHYGNNGRYTNYGALGKAFTALSYGLTQASEEAAMDYDTLGFPYKFGCDRGGADWDIILEMIDFHFRDHNVKNL
jgi:O-acetyl-ADP-ribose deacetylase (regulator of RNase III)